MADIPETPTNAARALIGWFAGAWAFESVHAFGEGSYVVFVGYGLVAVAVAIMDFRLPSLLAENPRLVRTLNQTAGDARWWAGIVLASILLVAASTFVAERRWPFTEPTFAGRLFPPRQESTHNQSNLRAALHDDLSPGALEVGGEIKARDGEGASITVQLFTYSDPHNGAQVIAAYIPMTSSTVDFARSIIQEHQALLQKLMPPKGAVSISAKGEHGSNSTDAVQFTGKIFIYHEKTLSPKEYSEIDNVAQSS
jgi:hypothetical protein